MLEHILASIRTSAKEQRAYFYGAKAEIASANLHTLRISSLATTVLLIFFINLTPVLFPNWKVTIEYILFIPFSAAFAFFSVEAVYQKLSNIRIITISCMLFKLMLISFLLAIDVLPYPESRAIFTPLLLAVCPVLFILPAYIELPFLLLWEGIFLFSTNLCKTGFYAASDTFSSLVGLFFGIVLFISITRIRIADYKMQTTYRDLSRLDGLTGLLNKYTAETMIRAYLSERDLDDDCALLIADLDNFKQINDHLGHHTGDALLVKTGELLSQTFRGEDLIGRFGGDEFLILVKHVHSNTDIEHCCKRLTAALSQLALDASLQKITCSIGAVRTTGSFIAYDDLFHMADDALYEAKNFGKNRYILRVPTVCEATDKKYMLIVDDLEINRAVIAANFQEDFSILPASDGHEALSLLSQYASQIAIVMLDIFMDGMDGYDLLRFMKSRTETARIPVIVITADADTEEKALSSGAADMLKQPIDPAIAKLRVSHVLQSGRP